MSPVDKRLRKSFIHRGEKWLTALFFSRTLIVISIVDNLGEGNEKNAICRRMGKDAS